MSDSQKKYLLPVEIKQFIHPDIAHQFRVVPKSKEGDRYYFFSDQKNITFLKKELSILLGLKELTIELLESVEFNRYLNTNYRENKGNQRGTLSYTQDFLEKILLTAKNIGSSDIHFEPFEERCRIRFRLDGKLKEQFNIPKEEYPIIINKIKNRASLDISQSRLPQDGRITIKTQTDEFDIRVSTLPSIQGESIVLRVLSKDTSSIELESLGFNTEDLKSYKAGVGKPNGIVLLSGPTGSGKTTTLYATLKMLNVVERKILTIEDPIEYTLEGIMQMQLREDIGLNFETALKTFLRQDPDVIMVGEIRDVKTANMAIRAALTGHLVLSTIHTNSAWATINRLVDMGVPAHLIASTLNVSVAQRLVRKLCNKCKMSKSYLPGDFPEAYSLPEEIDAHYIAQGCDDCYYTGYSGRIALYEILPVTKELAVHIKNNELQIDDYMNKANIKKLDYQAFLLIKDGTTSLDEVFTLLVN